MCGFVTARDTTSVYPTSEPRKHRAGGTQNPETPETVMDDSVPRHALQAASAEASCATGANKMASSHHPSRDSRKFAVFSNPLVLASFSQPFHDPRSAVDEVPDKHH